MKKPKEENTGLITGTGCEELKGIACYDISYYDDEALISELKRRGYTGTINPPTKSITL